MSFIELGNQLYDYYATGAGASLGYPSDWKDKFLDRSKVYVTAGDVVYVDGIKFHLHLLILGRYLERHQRQSSY